MGKTYALDACVELPVPLDRVFEFFADARNLGVITPPELRFTMRTPSPIDMRPGTLIDYTIGLWGIPLRWRTRIAEWNPPHGFVDEQLRGPYALWVHRHTFRAIDAQTTEIRDHVDYALPLDPLGRLAHPIVRRQLKRIFRYRTMAVREALVTKAAQGPAAR